MHSNNRPSWDEMLAMWKRCETIFCRDALKYQEDAFHWKDPAILVGGVGLAWGPSGYIRVHGSNYKPAPGTECPRCCMEEEIEAWAFLKGGEVLVGLATAAVHQFDDHTQRDMEGTLPLCLKCRTRIGGMIQTGDLYAPQTQVTAQRVDVLYKPTHIARYTLQKHFALFPTEEYHPTLEAPY